MRERCPTCGGRRNNTNLRLETLEAIPMSEHHTRCVKCRAVVAKSFTNPVNGWCVPCDEGHGVKKKGAVYASNQCPE